MPPMACSLHIMDVRILKLLIPALHEGMMPDLKEEVASRAHRDILLNWSRKIVAASTPLADNVSPAKWQLYSQFRPLFITADDPQKAVELMHRLFHAQSLDLVFDFFREEIARLDPDSADEIIETVRQDSTPGILPFQSIEETSENFRTYLLYHRRTLKALRDMAEASTLTKEMLEKAGKLLPWCLCHFLANIYPSWYITSSSFTHLEYRGDLGWDNVVADPRGMFNRFARLIPGLHEHFPIKLDAPRHTGLCIPPDEVARALSFLEAEIENPMPLNPRFGALIPEELQAIQEALLYAMLHQAGVWEAAGMLDPTRNIFPQIRDKQGEREEQQSVPVANSQPPAAPPEESKHSLKQDADIWLEQKVNAPATESVHAAEKTTSHHVKDENSWFMKIMKTKVF